MTEYATPKERAIAALKEFQRIQPTLSGYARAFTGKTGMRIIPTVGAPRTDGKAIYYQPPLQLADNIQHIKGACNEWGDDGIQKCPACMLRHDILFDILHEIGHVVEGSVDPLTDRDKTWAVVKATEILGENPRTRAMAAQIEKLAKQNRENWLSMAGTISPFMASLVNAFEDARINYKIGQARPGARRMRISNERRLDREGVKSFHPVTGEEMVQHFSETPFNHQAVIGLYIQAVGDEIAEGVLHPRVIEALSDERIMELCGQALAEAAPRNSYVTAVQAFVILREHGFFIHASDQFEEPPPPPPPPPVDDEVQEEGEEEDFDEDADDFDFPSLNIDPKEGDEGDGEDEADDELEDAEDDEEDSDADEDGEGDEGEDASDSGQEGQGQADHSDDKLEDGDRDDEASDEAESDTEDLGELEDDEDWGDGEKDWQAPQSPPSDRHDDGDEESPGEDESPTGSGVVESKDLPESEEEGGVELGDDADESVEDDGESPSSSTSSESSDPSDVEEEREGGSEGESDSMESNDEEAADRNDSEDGSGSESGGADEVDGDQELGDEGQGPESDPSAEDEDDASDDQVADGDGSGEGEGQADGDGDELLSGTESLSDTDRTDDALGDEEDGETPEEPQDEDTEPAPEWGDSEGALDILDYMLGHTHDDDDEEDEETKREEDAAMESAIMSAQYFDTSPQNILGLRLHREGAHESVQGMDMALAWTHAYDAHGAGYYSMHSRMDLGIDCKYGESYRPAESVVGGTLQNARLAFTANRRSRATRGLKSGKVDKRALGKRAPFDDPRVFQKTTRPGKRDYFVLIGMDVSGSTKGSTLNLEKKAVMAEAEVLARLGINFAIYAHSAKAHDMQFVEMSMDLYEIKAPGEAWNNSTRHRLAELGPDGGNVDGHTLEFYRKILDERKETDKILQYYTDGAMPAANFTEELEVMKRNIKICRDRGYTLMAVGVGTDSPAAHGFDTVRIDEVRDVARVVQQLGRRLQA